MTSTPRNDPVSSLAAAPVAKVLTTLVAVDRAFRLGETKASPIVTLYMAYGQSLRGWMLAVDEGPARCALLQLAETNGSRSDGVAYFDPLQVAALVIADARPIAAALSGGGVDPLDGVVEAPGKLTLARAAKDLSDTVGSALGRGFPIDIVWDDVDTSNPREMAAVAELLDLLGIELRKLVADEFAREALGSKIHAVTIAAARTRDGRVDERKTLSLDVPFSLGINDRFDSASLGALLNRVL